MSSFPRVWPEREGERKRCDQRDKRRRFTIAHVPRTRIKTLSPSLDLRFPPSDGGPAPSRSLRRRVSRSAERKRMQILRSRNIFLVRVHCSRRREPLLLSPRRCFARPLAHVSRLSFTVASFFRLFLRRRRRRRRRTLARPIVTFARAGGRAAHTAAAAPPTHTSANNMKTVLAAFGSVLVRSGLYYAKWQ